MTDSAKNIYQAYLDRASGLVWAFDYQTYADMMVYPHNIRTLYKETRNRTPADTVTSIRAFRENLSTLGAQAYLRITDHAAFDGPDTIKGTHTSFVLRGAAEVLPRYQVDITLHRVGDTWLGGDVFAKVRNADIKINATAAEDTTPAIKEANP